LIRSLAGNTVMFPRYSSFELRWAWQQASTHMVADYAGTGVTVGRHPFAHQAAAACERGGDSREAVRRTWSNKSRLVDIRVDEAAVIRSGLCTFSLS
jgi:hypothetical protein